MRVKPLGLDRINDGVSLWHRIVRFRLRIDLYNFVAAALAAASSRTPIISSVQGLQ